MVNKITINIDRNVYQSTFMCQYAVDFKFCVKIIMCFQLLIS